jgi:hypothetical protein
MPWRALVVFSSIAVAATTAIAVLCHANGWTVTSREWAILGPLAMWAPALARLVTRATVDRGFTGTLTIRRWGVTGARVILEPLALPLMVYSAAYFIAWTSGLVQFSPGAGKWASGAQIAANLVVNLQSLWPAVFLHSFHNTISQWLFPKFFVGGDADLLLGETGLLPAFGYAVLGVAVLLALRRDGPPWATLARSARPIM